MSVEFLKPQSLLGVNRYRDGGSMGVEYKAEPSGDRCELVLKVKDRDSSSSAEEHPGFKASELAVMLDIPHTSDVTGVVTPYVHEFKTEVSWTTAARIFDHLAPLIGYLDSESQASFMYLQHCASNDGGR
ncbi:MAG: hypothetical protein AAF842_08585 [Planctomycetota bacterium]